MVVKSLGNSEQCLSSVAVYMVRRSRTMVVVNQLIKRLLTLSFGVSVLISHREISSKNVNLDIFYSNTNGILPS